MKSIIQNQSFDRLQPDSLSDLVKWEDWDEESNSWEPKKSLIRA